jgi:parallel beta-helix repeat protein
MIALGKKHPGPSTCEGFTHFIGLIGAILIVACAQGAAAREIKVQSGQSIQAAVDRALPGDRIAVQPGTYHEPGRPCPTVPTSVCAVVISADGISLVAASQSGQPVILENSGGQVQGIVFAKPGVTGTQCLGNPKAHIKGAEVSGFVVRDFDASGIVLFCVDNWLVSSNIAVDNQLYGIYPVFSSDGRVYGNIASGSHDTGIYIGQSYNVRVDQNVAYNNVAGFEVESSISVELDHNESYKNTAGILMFINPRVTVLTSRQNLIQDNSVHDNNSPNTCLPGDEVCVVPPGFGISSLGGDHNNISHNMVTGNATIGIGLTDVCTALQIPSSSCSMLGFDPLPEATRIEFNTAQQNGSNPAPGFLGADLLWTANGAGNCWLHNVASVVIPSPLPACTSSSKN